jgi:hypothetical protein
MSELIFFTIGGPNGRLYVPMLRACIRSIRSFPEHMNIDILVVMDRGMKNACHAVPAQHLWDWDDVPSGVEASMRKVDIVPAIHERLPQYARVLYLDVDILVTRPILGEVFDALRPGVLNVYTEKTDQGAHLDLYYGLQKYTPEDLDAFAENQIHVFNCGHWGLVMDADLAQDFKNVSKMIRTHEGPYFYEQSFMNVYFNKAMKTQNTLQMYVYFVPPRPYPPKRSGNGPIWHFLGASTSPELKLDTMLRYLPPLSPTSMIVYVNHHDADSERIARESFSNWPMARFVRIPTTPLLESVQYCEDRPLGVLELPEWGNASFVGTIAYSGKRKIHFDTMDTDSIPFDTDVIALLHFKNDKLLKQAEASHPGFTYVWNIFLDSMDIPRDPVDCPKLFLCNYFLMTPPVFRSFCDFMHRAWLVARSDERLRPLLMTFDAHYCEYGNIPRAKLKEIYGVPWYPFLPFVFERCCPLFCALRGLRVHFL